jgi:hypothetical protein
MASRAHPMPPLRRRREHWRDVKKSSCPRRLPAKADIVNKGNLIMYIWHELIEIRKNVGCV